MAAVAATRAAVGDTMAIMVDLNQGWRMAGERRRSLDPVAARTIAARLAELDVLWVEEPLAGTDLRGLAALRASAPGIRIAGGEMTRTFAELAGRARRGRVRRPPAGRRACRRHVRGADASPSSRWPATAGSRPHTWTNGIGLLANLHVAAGVGGGPFLEFPYDPPGWTPERRDFMLAEPIRPGRRRDPARAAAPGSGSVLDEAAIRRYAA